MTRSSSVVLAAIAACSHPTSSLMYRAAAPVGPQPDQATIFFAGTVYDAVGSYVLWTIYDENTNFLGELGAESGFEATVPAGHHKFNAASLHGANPGSSLLQCAAFSGEFEAGKFYVALLHMDNDGGYWHAHWLFPHPGSKMLDASVVVWRRPFFRADVDAGQAYVDSIRAQVVDCHPVKIEGSHVEPEERDNPANFGFDALPRPPRH